MNAGKNQNHESGRLEKKWLLKLYKKMKIAMTPIGKMQMVMLLIPWPKMINLSCI